MSFPESLSKFIPRQKEAPEPKIRQRHFRVIHPHEEHVIIEQQHANRIKHEDLELEKAHEEYVAEVAKEKAKTPNTNEYP